MSGIEHVISFLLAAILVIVVPGPATFYVAGMAHRSARSAVVATAGIVAGDIVLIGLAGAGFAALVSQWPALLSAIKISGALYVAWLGFGMLRAPATPARTENAFAAAPSSKGFGKGLLITLTNPKPIVFFAAFFPLFISPATPSWLASFLMLGALFEVINLVYFTALILLIARLRQTTTYQRFATSGFNRISGVGLVLCSLLIFATLFS